MMLAFVLLLMSVAVSVGLALLIVRLWPTQTDRLVQRALTKGDPVRRGMFVVIGVIAAFMVWIDPWNIVWFGMAVGLGFGISKVARQR